MADRFNSSIIFVRSSNCVSRSIKSYFSSVASLTCPAPELRTKFNSVFEESIFLMPMARFLALDWSIPFAALELQSFGFVAVSVARLNSFCPTLRV